VQQLVAAPEAKSAPDSNVRGSETILLVEDAEPLRKLAHMFLQESGYDVLAAADGAEALETARGCSRPIHLLLTDVVMPGINGRVLAERLAPLQPGMKVLYMSGYTDSFIAGHGVLEQGTHLLHKPFTQEALAKKVRELLDSDGKALKIDTSVSQATAVSAGANARLKR
jgi:two-component system, cell cycle sensor histidine kinase and response regulator CckA